MGTLWGLLFRLAANATRTRKQGPHPSRPGRVVETRDPGRYTSVPTQYLCTME